LQKCFSSDTITNEMIQVTRKDAKESTENMLRRFNRKVQQSNVVNIVKQSQYFSPKMTKTERRKKAIIRAHRKAIKANKIKFGLR